MEIETLKMLISYIAFAFGGISIILMWVYLIETINGVDTQNFNLFKEYVGTAHAIFCLTTVILWITTTHMDNLLFWAHLVSAALWLLTGLASFILPINSRITNQSEVKIKIRKTFNSSLGKAFISFVALIFIF